MDLRQTKLRKEEWEQLEIPIIGKEKEIIQLINDCGCNINKNKSNTVSLLNFMKMSTDDLSIHKYLFDKTKKKYCFK